MRRNKLWNLAADAAQPLGACVPGLPLVELVGNRRVLIENHKGLVGYDRNEVCVKAKGGLIRISGRELCVCHMTNCALMIRGIVDTVALLEGGEK